MSNEVSYSNLLGYHPGSPFQLAAELRGASIMTDAAGNHVPYADLMAKSANAIESLLRAIGG
jgi:hypothetical protein